MQPPELRASEIRRDRSAVNSPTPKSKINDRTPDATHEKPENKTNFNQVLAEQTKRESFERAGHEEQALTKTSDAKTEVKSDSETASNADLREKKFKRQVAHVSSALSEIAALLNPRLQIAEIHHLRAQKAKVTPKLTEKSADKSAKRSEDKSEDKNIFPPRKNLPVSPGRVPVQHQEKAEAQAKNTHVETEKHAEKAAFKTEQVPERKSPASVTVTAPQNVQSPAAAQVVTAATHAASLRQISSTDYVRMRTSDRGGDASISLDLGDGVTLELKIQVRDGAANVVIQANHPELIHQMHDARAELAQALQSAGIDPESMQFGSGDGQRRGEGDEDQPIESVDDELQDAQEFNHIPGRLYIIT